MSFHLLGLCGFGVRATEIPGWPAPVTTTNGDVNGDDGLDISDPLYLLYHFFGGGPEPVPLGCGDELSVWQNGDTNVDWSVDLSDVLQVLAHLFLDGSPPVPSCCDHPEPFILPVDSRPYGLTYGEWSARWWQWVLCIPTDRNPAFDGPCDVAGALGDDRQSGPVFFLPGAFTDQPVQRFCALPAGRSIFFPIINVECSTPEAEPFHCEDADTCRVCATDFFGPEDSLTCAIDGIPVENPRDFRVASPFFHFTAPDNNIFGLPAGEGDSGSDGYWIMLCPLPPGEHLIHFTGRTDMFTQDVTYEILVVEG